MLRLCGSRLYRLAAETVADSLAARLVHELDRLNLASTVWVSGGCETYKSEQAWVAGEANLLLAELCRVVVRHDAFCLFHLRLEILQGHLVGKAFEEPGLFFVRPIRAEVIFIEFEHHEVA